MQEPVNADVDRPETTERTAVPRGPVVLDSSQWRWVAGGAPKGGWGADAVPRGDPTDAAETLAPKGGW